MTKFGQLSDAKESNIQAIQEMHEHYLYYIRISTEPNLYSSPDIGSFNKAGTTWD